MHDKKYCYYRMLCSKNASCKKAIPISQEVLDMAKGLKIDVDNFPNCFIPWFVPDKEVKMDQLYVRKGRRYEKVDKYRMLDCLDEGHWLVSVEKNNTAVRICIKPAYAEVLAAMEVATDAMCKAALKEAEMKPPSTLMSKKEQRAWAESWVVFRKIIGKDMPRSFTMSSIHDIIQAGINELKKRMGVKS